jgi:hypothetical protein
MTGHELAQEFILKLQPRGMQGLLVVLGGNADGTELAIYASPIALVTVRGKFQQVEPRVHPFRC